MTEKCVASLRECEPVGIPMQVSSVSQGAARQIGGDPLHTNHAKNVGFAFGMNFAIDHGTSYFGEPDYVLCFNNDLEFPEAAWLEELVKEAHPTRICVPTTDRTSLHAKPGPIASPPAKVQEMGAYCWLIPFAWCKWLKETYGFWLFSEEFAPAYGEDNLTSFLLSKKHGPKIFRLVFRSWVKHLRGKTSSVVKHDRRKSSRLLVEKLRQQLKDPKLRPDLCKWANSTIAILSRRM